MAGKFAVIEIIEGKIESYFNYSIKIAKICFNTTEYILVNDFITIEDA